MNTLTTNARQPIALAAAITLAVAGVTVMTMPTPTAEQLGDTTTPGPQLTPAAEFNGFCPSIGSLPGDPPQQNCTRIPVTVTAAYDTSAEVQ